MRWPRLLPFFLAASCVARSFPDYPAKPASEYSNTVTKSGIVVAAVVVDNIEEQRKYFDMDLTAKGFVPVFLVIQNQSTFSLLLRKDAIMYTPANVSGEPAPNPGKPSGSDKTLAVIGAVPTIYTFAATVMASRGKERRQNIIKREMQSNTVSPGMSAQGFVFVPAKAQKGTRQITLPFERPDAGDTVIVALPF